MIDRAGVRESVRGEDAAAAIPDGARLNVGSGPVTAPEWINIDGSWQAWLAGRRCLAPLVSAALGVQVGHWPRDIRYRDIRRGLGYADRSVAIVYASHVLEHLYRDEALAFLRDVRRSLAPGGVCRVVVPDVAAIVSWYLAHRREPAAQHTEPSSDLLMHMLLLRRDESGGRGLLATIRRWTDLHEHKWMYDEEGLAALFAAAGFASPAPRRYLDSRIPRALLEQIERADRMCDGAGVCVEAVA
ncbi:MAG TPA: methyltransferase domain-containing protein [Vicinamibacterales bacterium]|nr:methyltransferase domain-containing protein [Vicinamibacterales bacterium]